MERIRELLEKLGQLSTEELEELETAIDEAVSGLEGEATSPELVSQLNELADATEKVDARKTEKAEAEAQAEADAESARERIKNVRGDEAEDEASADDADKGDDEDKSDDDEEPVADGDVENADEHQPVIASGRVRRMARRSGKPDVSPEGEGAGPAQAVVVASGALRGIDPTKPVETREQLAEAMADTLKRMDRHGGARGDVLLASATWTYPEERLLGDDQAENARKIDAVVTESALTASGGVCAPVNVDYNVPTYSTAARPLKEGLAAFQVSRGGLRYITPPDISELEGATSIWTEATDAEPGVATKPVIHVTCGSEQLVYVDAVPTRLGFGNMQGQFSPEYVAANTDLAVAAASRIAENNLLKHIEESCVKNVKQKKVISAARDIITNVEQVVTAYRWLHRIDPSVKLTAILPDWVKALVKIDLAREPAHQQSSEWNVLEITDEQVVNLFEVHGVHPIFHLDGQAEPGSKNFPLQGFATPAENGEYYEKVFPAKVAWYLFVEGSIQFLDGGRLDLGVVRDSTLDATNDYETFIETFETIAFRGFTRGAWQLVSEWNALGQTQAPKEFATIA